MNTTTSVVKRETTPLATKPRALEVMAARVNVEPAKLMATLQSTCFKGASNEEMLALVVVANEYGLNPFLKEIYAFPKKGGGIVPVVGVDGWIKMVNRAQGFDGVEFEMELDGEGTPVSCTAILYLKDRTRPVKITEYLSECYRETDPWKNMPRRMLRHKALIQAARVAFGFAGINDEDEAIDIAATIEDVTPTNTRKLAPPAQAAASGDPAPANGGTREEFQKLMDENGIDFGTLQKWGEESGNIQDASSFASLADIPEDVLKRLLRARTGLITGLKAVKGAQS